MKKRIVLVVLASLLAFSGCGLLPNVKDNNKKSEEGSDDHERRISGAAAEETEKIEKETESVEVATGAVEEGEINNPVQEFNKEMMAKLTLILPGKCEDYSAANLADYTLLNMLAYPDTAKELNCLPVLEVTTGKTPVNLTYEIIEKGETAECRRIKTDEMEKFLSGIYGKNISIPQGTNIADANEFTNLDGYIAEWGSSYIVALEGGCMEINSSDMVTSEDGTVTLTVNGTFYERNLSAPYVCTTLWKQDSNSPVGYSIIKWDMDIDEDTLYGTSDEEGYSDSGNEYHYHDVESEVAQIKDWYNNPTSSEKTVTKTGGSSGLSREYYYHNGELFFAFLYNSSGVRHRLYFNNGDLIRYIDTNKTKYDYDDYNGNVPAPSDILALVASES